MDTQEQATQLLDTTMVTLTADMADSTPQSGKGTVDQWISLLSGQNDTAEVVALLESLKTQLTSGGANPGEMQQILLNLANHTQALLPALGAGSAVSLRLTALVSALQTTAAKLANA